MADISKKLEQGLERYYDTPGQEEIPGFMKKHMDEIGNWSDVLDDEESFMDQAIYKGEKLDINDEEPHDPKNPKKGCTDKHPALTFEFDDKVIGTVYGAACLYPIAEADLFISLDYHAPVFDWEQPWYVNEKNQRHIRYPIKDFSVPNDAQDFDACLDVAIEAMSEGKTVHVGCISGHGRTGMFLSALTQKLIGQELKEQNISAVDYVRDNYCAKVVETLEQVLFLHANFDVGIPLREASDVKFIKDEFQKEIGVSLDEIIQAGEYNACTEVINELESALLRKKAVKFPPPTMSANKDFWKRKL